MRRSVFVALMIAFCSLELATPALADNPHPPGGTGPPSQSCQALGLTTPGNSANSPGSPFNEPGSGGNSNNPGGNGGLNYSQNSQYDLACFQQSQHHG
jgi:hypothetical protein